MQVIGKSCSQAFTHHTWHGKDGFWWHAAINSKHDLYQPRVCLDYLQFARPTFGWNNWPPWGWSSPSQIESHPAQSWTSIVTNGVKSHHREVANKTEEDFFNLAVAFSNTCRCRFTFWPLPFFLRKKRCKYHLSVRIANLIESRCPHVLPALGCNK